MKLQELRTKISSGQIDTVIVGFPDVFGRLVGKRFTAPFFLRNVLGQGTHGCSYLLTVDIEMEPMEGFKLASWEKGFGDFEMRPDPATLRLLPWQPATALVLCELRQHSGKNALGARIEQPAHVFDLAHAAADSEGNEHGRGYRFDDVQDQVAPVR